MDTAVVSVDYGHMVNACGRLALGGGNCENATYAIHDRLAVIDPFSTSVGSLQKPKEAAATLLSKLTEYVPKVVD